MYLMLSSTASQMINGARTVLGTDCVRTLHVRLVTEKVLPVIHEQRIGVKKRTW
jgi:hypothetical protein